MAANSDAPSGASRFEKAAQYGGAQKGAKQFQEDSFFMFTSRFGRVIVGGIYDGHGGYNGQVASNTARDCSLEFLLQNDPVCEQWSVDTWRQQLVQLFANIHDTIRVRLVDQSSDRHVDMKAVVRSPNGDPVHGGSTGSIVVQLKRDDGSSVIISANVGDSTALLCSLDKQSKEPFVMLTVDHGPENQEEWNRVNKLPADQYPTKLMFVYDKTNVFRKYECPEVFHPVTGVRDEKLEKNPWVHGLHPTNVRYEPAVYAVTPREIVQDSTCIAMTRALGDFYAHQFGLTHVPDIQVRELPPGTECIVTVASDGIWDCWKYEEFADYFVTQVHSNAPLVSSGGVHGMEVSGAAVLAETIHRAITNFGAKHYDDAALVAWLITPATSKCLSGSGSGDIDASAAASAASSSSSSSPSDSCATSAACSTGISSDSLSATAGDSPALIAVEDSPME